MGYGVYQVLSTSASPLDAHTAILAEVRNLFNRMLLRAHTDYLVSLTALSAVCATNACKVKQADFCGVQHSVGPKHQAVLTTADEGHVIAAQAAWVGILGLTWI